MTEWVLGTGRIMTWKNQNAKRKTWPTATLSTTIPIWTGLQVNLGVCGERSTTNSRSHLPMVGKVTKECFLLYRSVLMCCTATQFCLKLAMNDKYCISNIWTVFFNIKYPSLLTKEQPVKTASSDGTYR